MKNLTSLSLALFSMGISFLETAVAEAVQPAAGESVVVLHGLARSSDSMSRMAHALELAGYHVCNISYPSRKHSVETLASEFVAPAIGKCISDISQPVHFVTHSLGGIIVRQLAASEAGINIGRVVMLSPPNQGSEVVDKLGKIHLFKLINGPAGEQLGIKQASLPHSLGAPAFELGVITGNRSINPLLSLLIPGADDGKVSVKNAHLDGLQAFLVVPSSHPFIMKNAQVIEQTLNFLKTGAFKHTASKTLQTTRETRASEGWR